MKYVSIDDVKELLDRLGTASKDKDNVIKGLLGAIPYVGAYFSLVYSDISEEMVDVSSILDNIIQNGSDDFEWLEKMFLSQLGTLSDAHLLTLMILDSPQIFSRDSCGVELDNMYAGNVEHHIMKVFSALKVMGCEKENDTEVKANLRGIIDDLTGYRLVSVPVGIGTSASTYTSRTTPRGKQFISWVYQKKLAKIV